MRDDFNKITLILENDKAKREITIDLNENIYKPRLSKAIKYIKKHCKTNPHLSALLVESEIVELLNILKGEDKE